jgi:hypothetical protein
VQLLNASTLGRSLDEEITEKKEVALHTLSFIKTLNKTIEPMQGLHL